jgi:tripartite-type tricarboxylate transporter receptor subunit TctC
MNFTRSTIAILTVAATAAPLAHAQDYPTRPIRIVTATPGGGNDFLARIVAPAMSSAFNQQVVVDNRTGRLVGGIVARAAPDGYTLAVGGNSMQFTPILEPGDYNMVQDFAPISQLERSPNVLVVHPSLKVNNVKEFIALAKTRGSPLLYGTGTSGGSLHVAGEMFTIATGVKMKRVPYKSTGPALISLLGNEVHAVFATAGGAMTHIRDGKLKALGVTSAKPFALIPDVPTIASQGVPGYDLDTIGFIVAPLKTPPQVIKRLNAVVVKAMQAPEVKARLAAGGSEAATSTPEELQTMLVEADANMRKLFKEIGLTPRK